jgi:DNA-binding CsgD family transcriptional regulator
LIRKQKQSAIADGQQLLLQPESYVLCERSSGAVRFRVDADADGSLPVDKIAGFLAVHCLVRGQVPEDYELMVVCRDSLLAAVANCAQQLLAAGRAFGAGVKVSRREQEVLGGILQNLANKEIASNLNVSERTVKFHVSSLLSKFGVSDRVALSRTASLGRIPASPPAGQTTPHVLFGIPVQAQEEGVPKAGDPPTFPRAAQNSRGNRGVFPILPRERFAT